MASGIHNSHWSENRFVGRTALHFICDYQLYNSKFTERQKITYNWKMLNEEQTVITDHSSNGAMIFMSALGIRILIANSCARWHRLHRIFKGLSHDGGRADFLKTSAPHSLVTTYRMKLLSARSFSLFCPPPYKWFCKIKK
jgi:hypothetical protein